MKDLSLVPIEDLITEIQNRTNHSVIAFTIQERGEEIIKTNWSEITKYAEILGLCDVIKRDIERYVESKERG